MNYSKIIYYDTANCYGFSTTIWISGCDRRCPNCFNSELQDRTYGKTFNEKTYQKILKSFDKHPFNKNFVILGGEPLNNYNYNEVISLCKRLKQDRPKITIIIYTGYKFEELPLTQEEGQCIDYIIDGPFIEELKPEKV